MSKRKSIKDNRILLVLMGILIVCFLLIGYSLYSYFYSKNSTGKYGDRLDNISNYPLSSTLEDDIKNIYSADTNIGEVIVNVKGRIIYITIDFVKSIKVATAKDSAIKSLEKIGDNNLTYYDVQYILTYSGSEENANFPVFGAKSSNNLKVVW
ncbi:MAG: hypothetical protein GX758_04570 [Tenericutes bacterium]|nr:hypothetical protein [Mycoplasmatota bacterium]